MCSRQSHRESPKPWSALVGAGPFNEGHFAKEAFGFVLAADGGYAHLAGHGLAPDFALGDFDSLGYVPADVPCEIHPTMKDASDTALALLGLRPGIMRQWRSTASLGASGPSTPLPPWPPLLGRPRRGCGWWRSGRNIWFGPSIPIARFRVVWNCLPCKRASCPCSLSEGRLRV